MMNPLELIGGAIGLYHIVPVNEAHVRILFDKKEVFASRRDLNTKPSYWTVPFVTKMHRMPLSNIRIDVPDVKLNDKNMAKFMCDIVCFVVIKDVQLAAERTFITITKKPYEERASGFEEIAQDFKAIMESVGRTVATKQSILEIYMDRSTLDNAVTKEVEAVFPKWGLELVDLEIKDVKDVDGSTIIQDIEKKRAAEINAEMRVKVAEQSKIASIAEAENSRTANVRSAEMEEEYRKRQIEKDRTIAISTQDMVMQSAKKEQEANAQKVEAKRTLDVGYAEVKMLETVQLADAEKEKLKRVAEGNASATQQTGQAEANVIKLKKVAEAEGVDRLAEAQRKFDDKATNIQWINASRDIGLAQAEAAKVGLAQAHINIVSGETQDLVNGSLLGKVSIGGKEGVALQQFLQGLTPEQIKFGMDMLSKGKKVE
jgi:uncharacterized membrane protein YqiK